MAFSRPWAGFVTIGGTYWRDLSMPIIDVCECCNYLQNIQPLPPLNLFSGCPWWLWPIWFKSNKSNWPKSSRTTRKEIQRRKGLDILQVIIFGSSFPNTFFGVRFAQYDCCIRTLEQRGSIWSTVGQVERYEYRQTEWLHILTNWIRKWTYRNGDYVQPTRWSFSGPRLNLTQMKTADNVGIIFRQPQTNSQTWSGLFKTSKVSFTG